MKRLARIVWRLREDALNERLRRAAFGDHECYPFTVPQSQVVATPDLECIQPDAEQRDAYGFGEGGTNG